MTEQEELNYLADLCSQAMLWRVDKEEGRTGLELEVLERIGKLRKKLEGQEQFICNEDAVKGLELDWVDANDGPLVPAKSKGSEKMEKYAQDHCKVRMEDGKTRWFPKRMCKQVPCAHSRTGMQWVLLTEEDYANPERNS